MSIRPPLYNIKVKYISCEKGAIEFMNLKESYRYANFLDNLLDTAYSYLRNKGFITSTKQNHLRSKVNNEVIDEITDVKKPYDVEFTPNNVIDFAVKVLSEKEKLSTAIACAKATTEINIDNAIAMYAPLDSVQSIPKSEKAKQTLLNFLCFECLKYTDENAQNGVVIIKNVAKISGLSNVAAALDGYWLLIISNGNRLNTQSFN